MIRDPAVGTVSLSAAGRPVPPDWQRRHRSLTPPPPAVPGSLARCRATTATWPSAGWSCRDQKSNLRDVPGRPRLGHGISPAMTKELA